MAVIDHYATLEVDPRASEEVIRAAHNALAAKATKARKEELDAALEVLGYPKKRVAYDAERNEQTGKVIGQYKVIEKIAEGGFGTTYKAEHVRLGTPVCIKHCSRIDRAMDRILEQEARAVWDLRHYAIPAMRDILRLDDGSSALVMSYVEGPTLEQIVQKSGQMDPEHVVWIMQRVLNALQYLHHHGVVHGDIKPQNIIVQPDKHMAVLVDYGLAMVKPKPSDENIGYTEVYSPPEQIEGKPLLPETDLYSLGMTALFALNANERLVQKKMVSNKVPKAMRDFLMGLIVRDTLARPNWSKVDLCDQIIEVRREAFGRAQSNLKPLTY